MRWLSGLLCGLSWAVGFGWPAAGAQAACSVTERAVVPVERAAGLFLVPLSVNDQPARFLFDTGAERTLISRDAARRLRLARDEWVATSMRGVSGAIERTRNANPRTLSLGGVMLRHRSVVQDNTLVVATLPAITPDAPVDGVLGRDFLAPFDISLDLSANTLRLFQVRDCAGRFLPWTTPYQGLPMQVPAAGAVILRVEVDGVPLRALLDTGANRSMIATPGLYRLGLHPGDEPAHLASGVGPRPVEIRERRFRSLRVGNEVVPAPSLLVADSHLFPIADMLLGADWLRGKAVWLSFATGQVFTTE